MKLKPFQIYTLVEQDVADGLEAGWHQARKHIAKPKKENVWEAQRKAIMLNLDEKFNLE